LTRALDCRGRPLELGRRTLVMGVVNATPDSFYAGSRSPDPEEAVARGVRMAEQGADVLDVGGESTRPGSHDVPVEEEIRRVVPVVEGLVRRVRVPVSVDTRKAEVAAAAFRAGAHMLNDVAALRGAGMAEVAREARVPVVLMHMRGEPKTMQKEVQYDDVVREVAAFLEERVAFAVAHGIPRDRLVLDPGLGFGKRTGAGVDDNVTLLARLPELKALGLPLLVGASRKTFLGHLVSRTPGTPAPAEERLEASVAAACLAAVQGAEIVRVHDVAETVKALRVVDAVRARMGKS